MNKKVSFLDWGVIDYKEAWDKQTGLFEETVALKLQNRRNEKEGIAPEQTNNYLIFCEHPPVFTLGKSGHESHLLLNTLQLEEKGIDYYKINRGGDITHHGPGQIVGYPLLDLDNFFTDIHKYLRLLEEAIILTLQDYGLEAGRIEGLTGVWLGIKKGEQPRKICAMGVKTSRWVTMHGFAFNVNNSLDYFNMIVPCGISDKAVTSLEKELGRECDIEDVKGKLKNHLKDLFEFQW